MTQLFLNPLTKFTSDNITALPGARLYFYQNNSSTPKVVYADKNKVTSLGVYVEADSAGIFEPIWLDGVYRATLRYSTNWTSDPTGTVQTGWPIDDIGDNNVTISEVKTSSTNRSSTTTKTADPDLVITGLAGSQYYHVTAQIVWNDNSGGAANGIGLSLYNGTDTVVSAIYNRVSGSTSSFSNNPLAYNFNAISAGTDETVIFDAVIALNSSSSSIALLWAQNTSSATNTTVKSGYISATKVG